jgi:hypothetical protein
VLTRPPFRQVEISTAKKVGMGVGAGVVGLIILL